MVKFIQRTLRVLQESPSEEIRKWYLRTEPEYCCHNCGINHEARDIIRAILLHALDHFEKSDQLIHFMKDTSLIDTEKFESSRALLLGRPAAYF